MSDIPSFCLLRQGTLMSLLRQSLSYVNGWNYWHILNSILNGFLYLVITLGRGLGNWTIFHDIDCGFFFFYIVE